MISQLITKRQEMDARQGYRRRRADRRHFTSAWIKRQPGRCYQGTEAITLADRHLKYVWRMSPYFPYTPGELARIYLDDLMRSQLGEHRISTHYKLTERDKALCDIQAPLYFNPERGRRARFIYIDINACYFELFKDMPLNLAYNADSGAVSWPRPALMIPPEDVEWLRAAKPLRHAMFGMMAAQGISWYQDGKPVSKQFLSDYAAPDLVALTKTRLRQIAREAVEKFDCRMWLTDAGIFALDSAALAGRVREPGGGSVLENDTGPSPHPFRSWLLERWGLESSVKAQGMGYLWGLGDYRVGRLVSKGLHVDLPGFSNL